MKESLKEWLPYILYIVGFSVAVGYWKNDVQNTRDRLDVLEKRVDANNQSLGRKIDNIYNILINKK